MVSMSSMAAKAHLRVSVRISRGLRVHVHIRTYIQRCTAVRSVSSVVYLIPYQVQSLVSDKEDTGATGTLSNGDGVMLAREKHDGHAGG